MTANSDNQLLKQIQRHIDNSPGKNTPQEIALALGLKERKVKKLLGKLKSEKKASPVNTIPGSLIKKRVILFSMLLIILGGFLVYANSLHGKFVWDDEILIQDNKEIQSWNNLSHIFTENIGTGAGRDYNFYRPLYIFTLMVNYSISKFDPVIYHVTNVLLHVLTALCIYILANLLFQKNILSLLTALFFVVHPIHTEVVSYISGRFDALSALFMLLCIIFYIKESRSTLLNIVLISICSILAILSKENALILPALILIYHFIFGRFDLKKFLPLLAISIGYIILRLTVLYFPNSPDDLSSTFFQRIPGFLVAVTNYATILILPFGLHMEHGDMLFKFSDPKAPLGLLIIVLCAFCAFKCRKNNKLVTFSILWFFICLLPESNLYRINAYMNEHWLYLPSFGFFLVLAKYLSDLYENRKFKVIVLIAGFGLLSFYSFLTVKQNDYWKEPVGFYERTLKYAPFSSRLYNNLARQYEMAGKNNEAIELFKKAIKINPHYAEAYNNMGVVFAKLDKNIDAAHAYQMAITIDPHLVGAYSNLGNTYGKLKMYDQAIDQFQKALKIRPDPSAYNNLAMIYLALKKNDAAIEMLKKAQMTDPNNITISFNLGNAYAANEMGPEAIKAYEQVIGLEPHHAMAYNNIGYLYKKMGKYDEAIAHFETALTLDPHMAVAYENLVLTYLKAGKKQQAIDECTKAIKADPLNADEYHDLLVSAQKP